MGADVPGDRRFADVEQQRRDKRASPDRTPIGRRVGKPLEEQAEDQREHAERCYEVYTLQDNAFTGRSSGPGRERGEARAYDERNRKQKSKGKN